LLPDTALKRHRLCLSLGLRFSLPTPSSHPLFVFSPPASPLVLAPGLSPSPIHTYLHTYIQKTYKQTYISVSVFPPGLSPSPLSPGSLGPFINLACYLGRQGGRRAGGSRNPSIYYMYISIYLSISLSLYVQDLEHVGDDRGDLRQAGRGRGSRDVGALQL
jgi:hypothetical protein